MTMTATRRTGAPMHHRLLPHRLLAPVLASLAWSATQVASQPEIERFSRKPRAFHEDVPYISCQACKLAVEELWNLAEAARAAAPGRRVGEDDLIELAESVCDPDMEEGEWMSMLDITQARKGASLKLEKQPHLGECRRECRTIAKACAQALDEHREDTAELLWKQDPSSMEKLISRVCTKWAKVCPAKQVPASYGRKDEWWFPMDEDSYKMRHMERQINKMTRKTGSQPVKFVDPMGGMMMGSDGWDDEEEEWTDPMASMMEDFAASDFGYGDDEADEGELAQGEL